MIVSEILEDGRTYTYSDAGFKIRQETGIIYESAIDTVSHTYTETDEPIELPNEEDGNVYGLRPDEPEEWKPPYMIGDKDIYNGSIWESTYDNNIYEPGFIGWSEVV